MNTTDRLKTAYTILPPPLSALPAKYHTPISLLLHSLSTGWLGSSLAELLYMEDEIITLSFILGLTHDIHQKLIKDGLASPKTAKQYLKEKLDKVDMGEYYNYVERAIDLDACGKNNPIPGAPKEVSTLCHIGDMVQGRFEGLSLLYWLRNIVSQLDPALTVRYYSIMIPQPFARSYIMQMLYHKYIADKNQVALTSPWGLYIITYEDELPEVLKVSWDDLRIGCNKETEKLLIVDYKNIIDSESEKKSTISTISIATWELKEKLWSRFAKMFYCHSKLGKDNPIYPVLDKSVEGLFINIDFTDIEFKEIPRKNTYTCGLCGMPHLPEHSLPLSMYGTKKGIKIAGIRVTPEKWNRKLPPGIKVKTEDTKGTWRNGIGMCPLCTLDAIGVRYSELSGLIEGFITVSISKPIPLDMLATIGRLMREIREDTYNKQKDKKELEGIIREMSSKPSIGVGRGLLVDFSSATIAIQSPEPKTNNMFDGGTLSYIGKFLEAGIYPIKHLPTLDTTIMDGLLTTPVSLPVAEVSVTSERHARLIPWIASLLSYAGRLERNKGLNYLSVPPSQAPLILLSINKYKYDEVSSLLTRIGVRI